MPGTGETVCPLLVRHQNQYVGFRHVLEEIEGFFIASLAISDIHDIDEIHRWSSGDDPLTGRKNSSAIP
jgi:hypothetical protein